MESTGNRRLSFIINPISGGVRKGRVEEKIRKHLDCRRYSYTIHYTGKAGDATGLAATAIGDGADAIVAVGGDGTVNEVARALIGSEVPLGIIPAGSGNGLALHLHIPLNVKRAIEVINRWNLKRIDTATIDDNFFINVAGAGFDAVVARKFARSSKRGFWSYFRIVVASYFRYRPKKYRLVIDGNPIERRALLVSFANSSQFGNNATIDPGASLDDGFIDVCIIKKVPLWKMIFMIPLIFLKRFDRTEYVEIFRAREVRVTRKKGKAVHIDGEPLTVGKEFTMRVNPQSIYILTP